MSTEFTKSIVDKLNQLTTAFFHKVAGIEAGAQVNPDNVVKASMLDGSTPLNAGEILFYDGSSQIPAQSDITTADTLHISVTGAPFGQDASDANVSLTAVNLRSYFNDRLNKGGATFLAIQLRGQTNFVYVQADTIAAATGGWTLTNLTWYGSELTGTGDSVWNVVCGSGAEFTKDIVDFVSSIKALFSPKESDFWSTYEDVLMSASITNKRYSLIVTSDTSGAPQDDNAYASFDVIPNNTTVTVFIAGTQFGSSDVDDPSNPPPNKTIGVSDIGSEIYIYFVGKPESYIKFTIQSNSITALGSGNAAGVYFRATTTVVGTIAAQFDNFIGVRDEIPTTFWNGIEIPWRVIVQEPQFVEKVAFKPKESDYWSVNAAWSTWESGTTDRKGDISFFTGTPSATTILWSGNATPVNWTTITHVYIAATQLNSASFVDAAATVVIPTPVVGDEFFIHADSPYDAGNYGRATVSAVTTVGTGDAKYYQLTVTMARFGEVTFGPNASGYWRITDEVPQGFVIPGNQVEIDNDFVRRVHALEGYPQSIFGQFATKLSESPLSNYVTAFLTALQNALFGLTSFINGLRERLQPPAEHRTLTGWRFRGADPSLSNVVTIPNDKDVGEVNPNQIWFNSDTASVAVLEAYLKMDHLVFVWKDASNYRAYIISQTSFSKSSGNYYVSFDSAKKSVVGTITKDDTVSVILAGPFPGWENVKDSVGSTGSNLKLVSEKGIRTALNAVGSFDIHDDISTALTTAADADRLAISDESASGDPTLYIEMSNVAKYTKTKNVPVSDTAPSSPTEGQLWVDTTGSDTVLKMYNGSAWVVQKITTEDILTTVENLSSSYVTYNFITGKNISDYDFIWIETSSATGTLPPKWIHFVNVERMKLQNQGVYGVWNLSLGGTTLSVRYASETTIQAKSLSTSSRMWRITGIKF